MEYLMDALASVLKDPLEDPFLFEWIVIQSRGMRQWISIELAKNLGICANIKYCFPREIIERFSNDNQSDVSFVFWKIMGLLLELINDKKYAGSFKSIKNYLEDDHAGVKLYQLTTRIADLFDDYRIYRPDILAKWQNKIPEGMDKYDFLKWQPVLFNKLIKNGFTATYCSLWNIIISSGIFKFF
jgi:exodeoxyribonuclease V gamma subunit